MQVSEHRKTHGESQERGPQNYALIHVAAGVSGFFVMGIELLGGRIFAPFFGTSIFVWGAIIAVFMMALALGYLKGGAISLKRTSSRLLGWLLVAEGMACLPIVLIGEPCLELLSYLVADARYGSLLGAMLFFALPAWISGMVSPYAVRLLTRSVQSVGHSAGRLYFVSTLGSALGTIVTSFYLVLYLELDSIVLLLVGMVIAIGVLLVVSRNDEGTHE